MQMNELALKHANLNMKSNLQYNCNISMQPSQHADRQPRRCHFIGATPHNAEPLVNSHPAVSSMHKISQ